MHHNPIDGGLAAEAAPQLLAFAARLRWRRARGAAVNASVRSGLLLAIPCIVAVWIVPSCVLPALSVLAVGVAAWALLAAWQARRVADAVLLRATLAPRERPDAAAESLAVLGDELVTWLECHRRATAASPMAAWLGRDLAAQLPDLPPAALAQLARPRLGRRWRRLVLLVALLLLAWLLSLWFWPPWPGALGGRATIDSPAAGDGNGNDGGSDGPAAPGGLGEGAPPPPEPLPAEQPTKAQPPPNAPPPPPPAPNDAPTPLPEPAAPLLELPEQQRFVVPEFLGDGPTKRVRMRAAELEQSGAAPRAGATGSSGNGSLPPAPPPSPAEFERAAEAALRARHVPPEEQPMVRRFFELLREAAKAK